MNDEVGISSKLDHLAPLERSGESLRNRKGQDLLSRKKKEKERGETPPDILEVKEDQDSDSPESPSCGKILDIVI
jgi:hypothetical protein